MLVLRLGFTINDCPVQATSPFLWVTIQSDLPSKFKTVKDVFGVLIPISKLRGVVEATL